MSSGKPICLTAAAKTPNMHTYRNAKASYFQINSKENIDFFRVLHLTALHCNFHALHCIALHCAIQNCHEKQCLNSV